MGLSFGLSKKKNRSSSQFNQSVFGAQGDALENAYGQFSELFDQTSGNAADQSQLGIDTQANTLGQIQNPFQEQLNGGAYSGMGLQDNLMSSINDSFANPSATSEINSMIMGGSGNNYADAMKDTFIRDANTAGENMLRNTDARAAASGMSGGSRQGTMQAQGYKDINQNLQANLADVGFNAFDKDLDRKLQIAGMADQNTFGRQQLLSGMLDKQNNAQTGALNYGGNLLNYGQQQQLMPWQTAGAYSDVLGDPTVLSTGKSSAKGSSFGASGSFGGFGK